jgi:spermidine synthase
MEPSSNPSNAAVHPSPAGQVPLLLAFLASGATGVACELLWSHRISAWFGVSYYAIATTLAAFMGGLALGGWAGGRWLATHPDRPLRAYALVELLIALSCVGLTVTLRASEPLMVLLAQSFPGHGFTAVAARFVLLGSLLLIPTTLMGASFPLFVQGLALRGHSPRRALAQAYGVNTVGAALGAAVTGLVLLSALGVTKAVLAAAALNLLAAGTAWWVDAGSTDRTTAATEPPPAENSPPLPMAVVGLLVALSGLGIMAWEGVWIRLYRQALHLTQPFHAFALVLALILLGMGLGSLATGSIGRHWTRRRLLLSFGSLQLTLAVMAVPSISQIRWALLRALPSGIDGRTATVALCLGSLLPAALAAGACFPTLGAVYASRHRDLGPRVGRLYALSTLGCVLGSIMGGMLLVPGLGLRWSLLALALLALACAAVAGALARSRWLLVASAAGAALLVAMGLFTRDVPDFSPKHEALFLADGVEASTVVARVRGKQQGPPHLCVNGMCMPGTPMAMRGALPMEIARDAQRVLLVGFGTGLTSQLLLERYPEVKVDCVELDGNQILSASHFGTQGLLDHPRFRLFVEDGRQHLMRSEEAYDVVIIDAFGQNINQEFYSLELFELAMAKTSSPRLFFAKLPLDVMRSAEDLDVVLRTAHAGFPEAWIATTPGILGLVGTTADYEPRMLGEVQTVAPKGRPQPGPTPFQVFPIDAEMIDAIGGDRLNTDDRPWFFSTPFAGLGRSPTRNEREMGRPEIRAHMEALGIHTEMPR